MPGLGALWGASENYSKARMDAKDTFSGPGSEIAAVPMAAEVPLYRCTVTESGYIADVVYARSADGLSLKPIARKHYHDSDTDEAGGLLADALWKNWDNIIDHPGYNMNDALYKYTVVGGGVAAVNQPGAGEVQLELKSSAGGTSVANDGITAFQGGPKIDFSKRVIFAILLGLNLNTGILWRSGVNMELATSGPDNVIKFGLEGCDGDGVNTQLVTADSISRTKLDTGVAMTSAVGYRIDYQPANKAAFDSTSGLIQNKTTQIPSSGITDRERFFRTGVKTTNTNQKILKMHMHRTLVYQGGSGWVWA